MTDRPETAQAEGSRDTQRSYSQELPKGAIKYWAIDFDSQGTVKCRYPEVDLLKFPSRSREMEPFESDEFRVVFIRMQAGLEFKSKSRYPHFSPIAVNLWDKHNSGKHLKFRVPLAVNLSEGSGKGDSRTSDAEEVLNLPRTTFMWEGKWNVYYRLLSSIGFNWVENGSFEAEIRLCEAGSQSHPIQEVLENRIGHPTSATTLYNGRPDFGAKLVALDYYSASSYYWIGFLNEFLENSSPSSVKGLKWGDISLDRSPKWGYAHLIANLRSSVEGHDSIIDIATRAIRLSASNLNETQQTNLEQILLTSEGWALSAHILMQRIQSRFDTVISIMEDGISKRQEAAVRLLTWIACIFLPLSTASSLLSMSSRAKDIGAVWWDWLGIVLIIGLLMLLGYAWAIKSYTLRHSLVFAMAWKIFTDAKKETLKACRTKHLVHPGVRYLFVLSISAFGLGGTAAFLIGMFVQLDTGVKLLGLIAAGSLGLIVGSLVVLRVVNTLLWLVTPIWRGCCIRPIPHFPRKLVPSQESRNVMLGLIILPMAFGLAFLPVLISSLVTGSIIFQLIYQLEKSRRKTLEIMNGRKKKRRKKSNEKKAQGKMKTTEVADEKAKDVDVEQLAGASDPMASESEITKQEDGPRILVNTGGSEIQDSHNEGTHAAVYVPEDGQGLLLLPRRDEADGRSEGI